jgi:hypothetical protein
MLFYYLFIMLFVLRSNSFQLSHWHMVKSFSRLAMKTGIIYLQVPFDERDAAKALGARYDAELKKWYVPAALDPKAFYRWQKIYLKVPFAEKAKAKEQGAMWDPQESKWFITGSKELKPFLQWINGVHLGAKAEDNAEKPISEKATPVINTATPTKKAWDKPAENEKKEKSSNISDATVLLVDCDTNGLPAKSHNNFPLYTSLKSYDTARIVQLSFALCDCKTLEPINAGSFIIRTDGFPIDNAEFHGVSLSTSLKKGIAFREAASALMNAAKQTNVILAHHAEFVYNVLKSEFFRHGMLDELSELEKKRELCSMLGTMNLLQLKDRIGNPKPISLKELVKFALKENLPQMHNSEVDVQYLRRALQKLSTEHKFTIEHSFDAFGKP